MSQLGLRVCRSKDFHQRGGTAVETIECCPECLDRVVPGISNGATRLEHWFEIAGDNNSLAFDPEHSRQAPCLVCIHHYQEISITYFRLCNGS